MLGTCPRCSKSRTLTLEGAALACPSCGYTDHVGSLPPPEGGLEPLWAPALFVCIGVSSVVFVVALLTARVATVNAVGIESEHPQVCALERGPMPPGCIDSSSPLAGW